MKIISHSEWVVEYEPTNENLLSDPPTHIPSQFVWTQVEGDEGEIVIASGWHSVNVLGYWITSQSHDYNVQVEDDD